MFSCFKKNEGYGYGDDLPLKVGFIVPHTSKAQGASSFDGRYTEYQYATYMLNSALLGDFPYFTRNDGGVVGAAQKLYNEGVRFSIEPHFNSFNESVQGFELLVLKNDKESIRYAHLIADYYALTFPYKKPRGDRGVKELSRGDRGYRNLKDAKFAGMKVAILSELFFGDCSDDLISPSTQAQFWYNTFNKKSAVI